MYAYEKLMDQHNLKVHNLPEDAQIGIREIKQLENAIRMTEKRGQSVTPEVRRKLQAKDKWVCTEIIDYLNDEDDDEDNEEGKVIKNELSAEQKLGLAIESELLAMLGNESSLEVEIDDLKQSAPRTYKHIFDNYDQGGENGVKTSRVELLEGEEEMVFTITKA